MPTNIIVKTKLHPPAPRADIQPRTELIAQLNSNHSAPLTLISAPAGYGKSTLAEQWLRADKLSMAWYAIDSSDSDPRLFFKYFIAAVQTHSKTACKATLALINAPELPPTMVLADQLTNDLAAIRKPFALVLDDFHRIQEDTVNTVISRILERPPHSLRLVITTRCDPQLNLTQLRAGGQLAEIREDDLRFTLEGTQQFIESFIGKQISQKALLHLHSEIEGWAVGLRLVCLALPNNSEPDAFLLNLNGGTQCIQDYLTNEVLTKQTAAVQRAMIITSILDQFSAPLCDALFADDESALPGIDGAAFVNFITTSNAFTIELASNHQWLRYHHLFQELLNKQLHQHFDEAAIATLQQRAGIWFQENNLIEEALRYFIRAKDYRKAAALIVQERDRQFTMDRWYVLERWLKMLPKETIFEDPQLIICQSHIAGCHWHLERLAQLIEHLESLVKSHPHQPAIVGEIAYLKGFLIFWSGNAQASHQHFELALASVSEGGFVTSEARLMLGLAQCLSGQAELACNSITREIDALSTEPYYRLSRLLATLAMIHLISNDLPQATRRSHELNLITKRGKISNAEAWSDYMSGSASLHANDLQNAKRHFQEAAQKRFTLETQASLNSLAGLALSFQLLQQPEAANKALNELEAYIHTLGNLQYQSILYSARARIALLQGDQAQALDYASRISESPTLAGSFMWTEVPPMTQARVFIASQVPQRLEQAEVILQELRAICETNHLTCQIVELDVLQALLDNARGNHSLASDALHRAIDQAKRGNTQRPFFETATQLKPILDRIAQPQLFPAWINQLNSAQKTQSSKQQTKRPASHEHAFLLTNRELDVLKLLSERLYDKEIAARLSISTETVRTHLKRIYGKLEVSGRRQATVAAKSLGIIN